MELIFTALIALTSLYLDVSRYIKACRLPFELICDGQPVPLRDRRYLLSPQDLAALDLLPELLSLGLASIKIEGRLKSPEYVVNITRIYRKALDRLGEAQRVVDSVARCSLPASGVMDENKGLLSLALSSRGGEGSGAAPREGRSAGGEQKAHSTAVPDHPSRVSSQDRYEMEMAFSRGLSTGWFRGTNNQQLVDGRFGKKRGVFLGEVTRVAGEGVWVKLKGPLKPGDGVVFDAGRPDQAEEGGRATSARSAPAPPPGGRWIARRSEVVTAYLSRA